MTDTVTAPDAEAPAATAEAPAEAKQPVSTKERITKAMDKDVPAAHTGFCEWMKAEADIDIDPTSVLATQSLYSLWRKTDEFQKIKDAQPTKAAASKVNVAEMTDAEKQEYLEKHRKETERRKKAQANADARAAEVEKFLREQGLLPANDETDDEQSAKSEATTDESTEEAF